MSQDVALAAAGNDGQTAGDGAAAGAASTSEAVAANANKESAGAEASTSAGESASTATPEELRAQLDILRKELASKLQKKQSIDRTLASHEASIYAFETSYLSVDLSGGPSSMTFGNIVKGYDSYLKASGATQTDSSRKKGGSSTRGGGYTTTAIVGPGGQLFQAVEEQDRLFSKSSSTYTDSLQLRDRDAGAVSASDGEDDGDADDAASTVNASKPPSATLPPHQQSQPQASTSEQSSGRDAKRPRKR